MVEKYWVNFMHDRDIGVRGIGKTKGEAFEQAAIALTALVADPDKVAPKEVIAITCETPDEALLFRDYLNALVYEMATRKMLFNRVEVQFDEQQLHAKAWGEKIDRSKHEPAVDIKGATDTDLLVKQDNDGTWMAQCIVDVCDRES